MQCLPASYSDTETKTSHCEKKKEKNHRRERKKKILPSIVGSRNDNDRRIIHRVFYRLRGAGRSLRREPRAYILNNYSQLRSFDAYFPLVFKETAAQVERPECTNEEESRSQGQGPTTDD